jgi:hypothetical protein
LLWFVLIATLLASEHPNRKSRFLHTWLAGLWVVAGAGLANLVYARPELFRSLAGRRSEPPLTDSPDVAGDITDRSRHGVAVPAYRAALGCAALGALALLHLPVALQGGHSEEGGPVPDAPTTFELTDRFLPVLKGAEHPLIMSNQPLAPLVRWTYLDWYPRQTRPEIDIKNFGKSSTEDNRAIFAHWLATTRCDDVVYIHIRPGSPFHDFADFPAQDQLCQLLAEQDVFRLTRTWELPDLGAVIYHWSRRSDAMNATRSAGNGMVK